MKDYQFISWFPDWGGFSFVRANPDSDIRYIYEWFLYIGFWEIRKWSTLKLPK